MRVQGRVWAGIGVRSYAGTWAQSGVGAGVRSRLALGCGPMQVQGRGLV